jgi:excisionase family DNA binding protein
MSETDTKLMTVSDVAERTKVTTQIVYRWIATGDLDFYNLGTGSKKASFRISEEHLKTFLESSEGMKL